MPPRLYAIFDSQIPGDESLRRLAQARFAAAHLLPEFYPKSPDELLREIAFHPQPGQPFSVHLPRSLRLLQSKSRDAILGFAGRFAKQAAGMVVHDQPEVETHFDDYIAAVKDLDSRLMDQGEGPMLFIEYAAGITPQRYVSLFEAVQSCRRVSACIDISHIGIRQSQRAYAEKHPHEDVCRLKWSHPELPQKIVEVQAACATALPVVRQTVRAIGKLGKPLHFHLHDGHPTSTHSLYGVSDHLSFFHEIYLPFTHEGTRLVPLLYGPLGLKCIIDTARNVLPDEKLSFTLEVHPPDGKLDLGEYDEFFTHWTNKENAERMNHWVEVLLRCARLVRDAFKAVD